MRKLVPLLALLLFGCGRGLREPFDLRQRVAVISDESAEVRIYEHAAGYGYWVPIQDVTRTVLQSFVIESETRQKRTGQVSVSRSGNLVQSTSDSNTVFPGFLGATVSVGFWSSPRGFFVVDFADGSFREWPCDREFVAFGNWERIGDKSIRRRNEHGVFEFTSEGAKQVTEAQGETNTSYLESLQNENVPSR